MKTSVEVDTRFHSLLTSVLESSRPHSWGGWMDALEKRKMFSLGLPGRNLFPVLNELFRIVLLKNIKDLSQSYLWIILVASGIFYYLYFNFSALPSPRLHNSTLSIAFTSLCTSERATGRVVVYSLSLLVLILGGGDWSASRSGPFLQLEKSPRNPSNRRLVIILSLSRHCGEY